MTDLEAMNLALQIARRGIGQVSPNPLVGCVVLNAKNQLISVGAHEKYGDRHAEANALSGLTESQLKGARVFVTLEPCAHQGKQPPCAQTLGALPLAEVVFGSKDPNPLVASKGIALLQQKGIRTKFFSDLEAECLQLAEHFHVNMQEKRSFVSLKIASSLDQQMALASSQRVKITGNEARHFAHELRAHHDASLVGVSTVLLDNPRYDIRNPNWSHLKKVVVILDPEGKIFEAAHANLQIWNQHEPAKLWVLTEKKLHTKKARVLQLKNCHDLSLVLDCLWREHLYSILIESGPRLTNSFLNQNLFDRLYLFQAPKFLGSDSGRNWSNQIKMADESLVQSLHRAKVIALGADVLITGRRKNLVYG